MLKNKLKKQNGQSLVEYGLITALMAIIIVSVLVMLGPRISEMFERTGADDMVDESEVTLAEQFGWVEPFSIAAVFSQTSFNLSNYPALGTQVTLTAEIDADYLANTDVATLVITAHDLDIDGEAVLYINGNAYELPRTGNEVTSDITIDVPTSHLVGGSNDFTFEFADDGGGSYKMGFNIDNIALTLEG